MKSSKVIKLPKDAAALSAEELEVMAAVLEGTADYKVLRRLPPDFLPKAPLDDREIFRGVFVDTETTGLDVERDLVIELALVPFTFDSDGSMFEGWCADCQWYQDTKVPLTDEVMRLTGITPETIKGKAIDRTLMKRVVDKSDLVVAHHAAFDRPMLERLDDIFVKKSWACSMEQVPWKDHGFSGRRLEYLLAGMGLFYNAHGALDDSRAGVYALAQQLGAPADPTEHEQALAGGAVFRTGLSHLLEASRSASYHVWAIDAPYEVKDKLKARGYSWNGGEDRRPKAWHKEVPSSESDAEAGWLAQNVYPRDMKARFDRVTARDRFTKRG